MIYPVCSYFKKCCLAVLDLVVVFIDLCERFSFTTNFLSLIPSKSQREISMNYYSYLGIFFPKCINSHKKSTWSLLFLTAGRWK